MDNRRQYTRVECDSECILMEIDGDTYDVLLDDLSLGGAFITMRNGLPNSLNVGDACSLMLCSDPGSCPTKHFCRVVRQGSVNMGVTFLTTRDQ
jgi:c-di-GMP-binding flagellar brake protein YcgR